MLLQLFALFVSLEPAQGNHLPSVDPPWTLSTILPPSQNCGSNLVAGKSCNCTGFGFDIFFVAGFAGTAAACPDGSGCMSQINQALCVSPDQFSTDSNNYLLQNITWDPATGLRCADGYYMHAIYPSGSGNTAATAMATALCRSQSGMSRSSLATVNVPWNTTRTECPTKYLVTGIQVSNHGNYSSDLSDFASLICSLPAPGLCTYPVPGPHSVQVLNDPGNCTPPNNFHLGCSFRDFCQTGYGTNSSATAQPANRTCERGTGEFLVVGNIGTDCRNLNECLGYCKNFDRPSDGPCHTCSPNALCSDTDGGYTCTCNPGYVGDGYNCTTKPYCSRACNPGESPANATCHDCPRWSASVPSSFEAACILTSGNFICGCPLGYRGSNDVASNLNCSEINECKEETDNCPRQANGSRIAGSLCNDVGPYPTAENVFYTCTCDLGFTNAPNCTDVNECNRTCATASEAASSLFYGCNTCDLAKSNCTNNVGSVATCSCLPGFVMNVSSGLCVDFDECSTDPCGIGGGSSGLCLNLNNKYECLPIITNVTLIGPPNRSTPFNLTSTSQAIADRVLLTIKQPTLGIRWNQSFTYGSSSQPTAFRANSSQVNTTSYLCNMVSGAGGNLTFSTTTCLIASGCSTAITISYPTFKFSYPPPQLNVGGLCAGGSCGNINVSLLAVVTLNGSNFANDKALMKVSFGITNANHSCPIVSTTFDSLTCVPESVFGEQYFRFWVTVGAQDESAQTAVGQDRFNFSAASGASVVSIVPANLSAAQGCTSIGRTLVNCPCVGGVEVVVTADSQLTAVSFQVDGNACQITSFTENTTSLKCILPPGVGDLRPVGLTTASGTKPGPIEGLVSYQAPVINSISCSQCTPVSARSLTNCSRAGGGDVTIFGSNFGTLGGALILTNFQNIAAIHSSNNPDGSLKFTLPNGTGTQTIIVFQRNGKGSTVLVTYSYLPCDPGSYVSGISCVPCPPGTISDTPGALDCTNCSRGTSQPESGKTKCEDCIAGQYANQTGTVNCTLCVPGTKASFSGSLACSLCDAGFFADQSGSTVCKSCAIGRSTNATGQSVCADCVPGTAGLGCAPCEKGKIAARVAQAACDVCAPGKYQNQTGQINCLDCSAGTYSTITKADSCSFCGPGTHAAPDRESCISCLAGRFQNSSTTPQTECANCSIGRVAGPGATVCSACEGGRFMDQEGGQLCLACVAGTYLPNNSTGFVCLACQPGRRSPTEAAITCEDCPMGEFQNASNSPQCMQCPPGTFTNTTGSTACHSCPQGYSQAVSGQSECVPCQAGRSTDQNGCQACAPGSFSESQGSPNCSLCPPGKTSSQGKTACSACTEGTYSSNFGQSQCYQCPNGAHVDKYLQGCACPAGTYSVPIKGADNFSSYFCVVCRTGYVCLQEGLTFSALQEAPGYWRPPLAAGSYDTTIYRCVNPDLCLGARQCRPNRVGPMCAICAPGYKASGPAGACEYCGDDLGATWGYTVGIVILVLFLLCVFYYIVLRVTSSQQAKLEKLANMKDARAIQEIEELQSEFAVDDAYFEQERTHFAAQSQTTSTAEVEPEPEPEPQKEQSSADERRVSRAAMDREKISRQGSSFKSPIAVASHHTLARVVRPGDKSVPDEFVNQGSTFRLKHLSMASRRAPNFMYKVKILVGFFQIASIMPLQGEIAWPTAWTTFISAFSILNFDFIPWQTLTCATKMTYFGRSILVGCIPIAAVLALVLFFYVPMYLRDLDSITDQLKKQHKRNARNRQFVRLLLFTAFLLYPFVSKVVLGVYNCITVEGVSYLVADFGLVCFDSTWNSYAGVCVIFVLMYPVGIPVAYYFILRRSFAHLHEPAVILQFGFLYEAYTDTRWFWELIDLVHKLILTSVVIFAPSTWILGVNMFIICAYLILILLCHPYIRKGDDRFHLLTQTELFLLALVGYIIQREHIVFIDDPAMDALLSACLITLVLFLVLSFFVIAGRNVHKIWTHAKAKKQAKAMMAATTKSVSPSLEQPKQPAEPPKPRPAPLEL